VITFDIKQYVELTQYLQQNVSSALNRGIGSAAFRVLQDIVVTVQGMPERERPFNQGAYLAGWHVEPTAVGADVVNDAPHAPHIEWGVRADHVKIGRKMIDALAEWAVRKGLLGKGPGSIQERSAGDDAQSLAWAIAKNMQKVGIFNRNGREGLRIAEDAARRSPALIIEEVRAEIQAALGGR
jgi:hypothetical protein